MGYLHPKQQSWNRGSNIFNSKTIHKEVNGQNVSFFPCGDAVSDTIPKKSNQKETEETTC